MIAVRAFRSADGPAVIDHVLGIQRREFGLALEASDQPDLLDVCGHYQHHGGGFWVATGHVGVVGTVGLLDIGQGHAVLRKMFVAASARGRAAGVASTLLGRAIDQARTAGLHTLWLGTTEAFTAAHRFYEKHGFERVEPGLLPASFPRMAVDTRFYRRALHKPVGAPC